MLGIFLRKQTLKKIPSEIWDDPFFCYEFLQIQLHLHFYSFLSPLPVSSFSSSSYSLLYPVLSFLKENLSLFPEDWPPPVLCKISKKRKQILIIFYINHVLSSHILWWFDNLKLLNLVNFLEFWFRA